MKNKKKMIYLAITLISLLLIGGVFYYVFVLYERSETEIRDRTVLNVIDGDTFEYYDASSDMIKTVRLLCVDTPEKGEEGYEEAKNFLEDLILGEQVILEKDVSETDKYGRLLRYVYLKNGILINDLIIQNDYGELLIIDPDTCDEIK